MRSTAFSREGGGPPYQPSLNPAASDRGAPPKGATMTYVYAVIPADLAERVVFHRVPEGLTLQELQEAIGGGYVELVPAPEKKVHPTMTVWVDEDGLSKDLPYNLRATALTSSKDERRLVNCWGTAVVMGLVDGEGGTLSLDDDQIASLQAMDEAAKQKEREDRL